MMIIILIEANHKTIGSTGDHCSKDLSVMMMKWSEVTDWNHVFALSFSVPSRQVDNAQLLSCKCYLNVCPACEAATNYASSRMGHRCKTTQRAACSVCAVQATVTFRCRRLTPLTFSKYRFLYHFLEKRWNFLSWLLIKTLGISGTNAFQSLHSWLLSWLSWQR